MSKKRSFDHVNYTEYVFLMDNINVNGTFVKVKHLPDVRHTPNI